MGWFDEQIKQRMRADEDAFSDAFSAMAGSVLGRDFQRAAGADQGKTKDAVNEILKHYGVKPTDLPKEITEINQQLEYLLRPAGVMRRTVYLEGDWYRETVGAFLAIHKGGGVVALLPNSVSGYTFFDHKQGKRVTVNRTTAALLEREAICLYRPLPLKKLGVRDLLRYIAKTLSPLEYILMGAATVAVTLIGLLVPRLTGIIFSTVIASGSMELFFAVAVMLAAATLSGLLIAEVRGAVGERLQAKSGAAVQAAAMMRLLSLPTDFFKGYSAGELANRIHGINWLCTMLSTVIFTSGLLCVCTVAYIVQVFFYAPALVAPALGIVAATVLAAVLTVVVQMKVLHKKVALEAKEFGLLYGFITGVQKLKLAGAEKRAFARWANVYSQKAALTYDPPALLKLGGVITLAISLVGTMILYACGIASGISVANYLAFHVAYGIVMGEFSALASIVQSIAVLPSMLEMVKPILETAPEISPGKKIVTHITGGIEMNNVSFRYGEGMPLIVDNLSLKIEPGQYVALVGKTGCGKSTLMRLMLGFETPQKGAIYYDSKDLAGVDLRSLRRCLGVVMQNGKLFAGDIFANITISAPWLTMDEAWQAAELAGIADDIRAMPMGMHTMISEGSGGVSGGQRQRLMIARAVAPNPRVLLFDEATSALDNLIQQKVAQALAQLKCTRIVIAHRLSTIRTCDRIIVLEGGRIMEDGTYEALMQKNGYFAQLVERQQMKKIQNME